MVNILKGICNQRCFNAEGSKCRCRCNKTYHGLGSKKNPTEEDKEKIKSLVLKVNNTNLIPPMAIVEFRSWPGKPKLMEVA